MPGREWYLAEPIVTTPAGTLITSPQVTTILTGDNYVRWIRWRFPPGPAGTLHISFYNLTAQIVPWTGQGTYIPGNDEWETAEIDYPCLGAVKLQSYNTGTYDHAIIVSIQYQPIAVTTAAQNPPAPSNVYLIASDVLSQPSDVPDADLTLEEVIASQT